MPRMTFRLYAVECNNASVTFGQALEHIFRELPENRIQNVGEHEGFLFDIRSILQIQTYLFSKLRMDDLPSATSRLGVRTPLNLAADQGLGEEMAMGYDAGLGVVSIQASGYSFRPSRIAQYINTFFPDIEARFLPIISPDIVQRFRRMSILRKLSFRIASTTNLDFLQQSGLSAAERNALQEFLLAPHLDITLSVGNGRRDIGLVDRVKHFASVLSHAAWGRGEEGIERLVVTGKDDEFSKSDTIDLLENQVQYVADVQSQGRSIDIDHLCRTAAAAINDNRQVLRQRNVT
ncbi:MAG: hypothetical protein HY795_04390 [Desulfovibrio sp.]|nr:hypothetical protein [Desulfovibrio sp.]MBI4960411.1 hypothetical protein [Desulfovibrio sp.]